jgi:hypothetical protein
MAREILPDRGVGARPAVAPGACAQFQAEVGDFIFARNEPSHLSSRVCSGAMTALTQVKGQPPALLPGERGTFGGETAAASAIALATALHFVPNHGSQTQQLPLPGVVAGLAAPSMVAIRFFGPEPHRAPILIASLSGTALALLAVRREWLVLAGSVNCQRRPLAAVRVRG